ncbi:MAG TPA: methyl-coenzyme M reductase subunit beta, partial [Methanoregulaceae archaeon]|nr:methyl-coenzyme M reductase subunit beta [Methanoregulaceae archaeon]
MAKYTETIDLYDDVGKLLKSGVALDKISPVTNPGIGKIIDLTKRTVAVNLGGLEAALASGKVGGKFNQVLGYNKDFSIVKDSGAIAEKIKKMVQVAEGDDTKITS